MRTYLLSFGRAFRFKYFNLKSSLKSMATSEISYLGQEAAQQFDNALFYDYKYSIDQLMEIAGLCCAQGLSTVYSNVSSKVLIICGPGNNGGDGLAAARHLLSFGYTVDIYYPKKTSKPIYDILVNQCSKLHIPFLSEMPPVDHINSSYDVILDAIFGFSFKGSVRPPFDSILATLNKCQVPICSVDVPSGWDVEKGDINGTGIKPNVLISLTCPKLCAKFFTGRHLLGLRVVPPELAERFGVILPSYHGIDQITEISSKTKSTV